MSGYPVGKKFDFGRLEKTFLSEVCHYGKNNQHCACTNVQFILARRATCDNAPHTTLAHSSIARNLADSQIEVLVQHESCTCWTNKKRADWPQLSQTVHVLNRFCWTDWLKTSPIVSSRSTLHYITPHYTTLHHITPHYATLRHITPHYATLRHITPHYATLRHITPHYATLHYITLHCIALHCIAVHYITLHYITLHYITLHYITLHYITLWSVSEIFSHTHIFLRLYNLPPRQAFWSSRRPDSLAITNMQQRALLNIALLTGL